MAKFYDVHGKDIEQAFYSTRRTGEHFRIYVRESVVAPCTLRTNYRLDEPVADEVLLIVTFLRLPQGRYEAAGEVDRKTIADWEQRHRESPDA